MSRGNAKYFSATDGQARVTYAAVTQPGPVGLASLVAAFPGTEVRIGEAVLPWGAGVAPSPAGDAHHAASVAAGGRPWTADRVRARPMRAAAAKEGER